ncbi:MAG: DUF3179 domain-containing protein [Chloroflexota bacterium]|nr:DUF3179 domain-containing protein [Chloroflexota bacterium]
MVLLRHIAIVPLLTFALAACAGTVPPAPSPSSTASPAGVASPAGAIAPSPPATAATPIPRPPDLAGAHFSTVGWKTDFARHSVPLAEIRSGGPGRDGIPPLDAPKFVGVEEVPWLKPREPVILFAVGDDARAYPLQILIWHEIVNDVVGGAPVAVTFCPLCNTAIAFDRRLDGRTLDFGTTGKLRRSDLVMWDRQTESWWQQITGEAIVGELTGRHLTMLPATIVAWEEFRARFPHGQVLSRETGHDRDYGRNPYAGYDEVDTPPFLLDERPDGRLPPKERVVTVSLGGEDVAYPFGRLAERRTIADTVGGQPLVVLFQPGTASALDQGDIASSRDVGAVGVYRPQAGGRALTFAWRDGAFTDEETGSRWTLLGEATAGSLTGQRLEPVVHGTHFWFAWAAFKPQTRIYGRP